MAEFGRAARRHWSFADDAAYLNHGSFGACPRVVRAEQERIRARLDAGPDAFYRGEVHPLRDDTPLRRAAARLAAFVGGPAERIAFVENATSGVQVVLRSMPLAPGDEILITDHTYNAVRLMVEARCAETGAVARVARIPIPATREGILEAVEAAITPRVRLAILDHITSATAIAMPLEALVPMLRRAGARVLIDGAHAVGQVPLDVEAVGADWYVSNGHKWLYAAQGTAFLHAAEGAAAMLRPPVASHYVELGFPRAFDWLGTRDYSGWLATPVAIDFHASLGAEALRAWQARLLEKATELLQGIGFVPVAPMSLCAAMRSFIVPFPGPAARQDALELMDALWERDRIQSMAAALGDKLLFRVSAQAYVDEDDLLRLRAALARRFA